MNKLAVWIITLILRSSNSSTLLKVLSAVRDSFSIRLSYSDGGDGKIEVKDLAFIVEDGIMYLPYRPYQVPTQSQLN